MGTRGFVGIRKKGVDKGGYNGSCSYPDGLGVSLLMFLKGQTTETLENLYETIKDDKESEESEVWDWEENKFAECFSFDVDFLYDSLFCEYAYIINLDECVLEFYKGFNKNPKANGRYANNTIYRDENSYYGVALIDTIPLKDLFEGKVDIENGVFLIKG